MAGWTRVDAYAAGVVHDPTGPGSGQPEVEAETREQACARAYAEGRASAAKDHAEESERLRALVAAATALQPEPSAELAVLIVRAVVGLAREAVGAAPVDAEWLRARAREAAAVISQCDAAQTIWVHPDDVALLEGADLAMAVHPDPTAARGSIRIACSSGWIEHGRPLYLEQLDAILAAGGPGS